MSEITGPVIARIFGQNLRRLRMRKNISQLALATKVSLTHNFINEVENGRKWVSSDTFARLVNILDTDPFQFFVSDPPEKVEAEILNEYLEDMSDSFSRMVAGFRETYLHRQDPTMAGAGQKSGGPGFPGRKRKD